VAPGDIGAVALGEADAVALGETDAAALGEETAADGHAVRDGAGVAGAKNACRLGGAVKIGGGTVALAVGRGVGVGVGGCAPGMLSATCRLSATRLVGSGTYPDDVDSSA
jgi:hypothetical protein